MLATVKGAYGKGVIYYDHTDHLSGSAVVSDTSGRIMEMTDYYPYGAIRIHKQSFGSNEQRKFIGEEYDGATSLSYLNARYYDGRRGQFLSEDPVFWEPERVLEDPQQLNSYSYARNNPVRYSDPNGESIADQLAYIQRQIYAIQAHIDALKVSLGGGAESAYQSSSVARVAMDHPYVPAIVGATPLAIYGGSTAVAALSARTAITATPTAIGTGGTLCQKYCPDAQKLLNPGINNIGTRIGHVFSRHGFGTTQDNVSVFNAGEDIAGLIRSGTQQVMRLQPNGNYVRVFDVGRNIGFDRATGGQTSIMSIVTNQYHNLVTSFPGLPPY